MPLKAGKTNDQQTIATLCRCDMATLHRHHRQCDAMGGDAMKSGFNLIHKADIIKQIDTLIEAAKMAGDESGVKWLELLKKQYQD